jgi:type VI secretion system secreted protein Hcp
MAVDMFLKLDGIKGESTDSKHKDEIDVLSWSWGMTQSGSTHIGGGGGSGKVNIQDISLTKRLDTASPTLSARCAQGEHIKEALLTVRKAGTDQQEYVKITLKDCLVSSLSTGASGGQDTLIENISLNFAEYKFEYWPQKKDGTLGGVVASGYNIKENKKA